LPTPENPSSLLEIHNTMKSAPLILLFCATQAVVVAQQPAAEAPVDEAPAIAAEGNPLTDLQKAFSNLPEERRKEFIKHLEEATRLFQQKRIFETIDQLDKADAIFPNSPEVLNIRGSCLVEFRAFDKAIAAFKEALKLSPDNPSIEFNIGEVYFVSKQWQEAHDVFSKVLGSLDKPEHLALSRLTEFKILLCKNKLGQKDEVLELAEKYDFLDDSPYHYYAKAALAYEANDLIKAEEWLAIASRIFQDPNIIAPWQDTLVEYGYIKSFYGDDAAP
jgi:tetratricopeptide (TPR) repeat protein